MHINLPVQIILTKINNTDKDDSASNSINTSIDMHIDV